VRCVLLTSLSPPLPTSSPIQGALEDFDHLEAEERDRATAAAAAAAAAPPAVVDAASAAPQPRAAAGAEQQEGSEAEDDADLDNLPPELMDGLKKLVEELSINKEGGGAGVPGDLGLGSEEMMKEALEQLEGSPEFASIMEKMMGSLLSKDVLYEPIKQMKEKVRFCFSPTLPASPVCACVCVCVWRAVILPLLVIALQYPEWLANNRDKVSEEDFTRYSPCTLRSRALRRRLAHGACASTLAHASHPTVSMSVSVSACAQSQILQAVRIRSAIVRALRERWQHGRDHERHAGGTPFHPPKGLLLLATEAQASAVLTLSLPPPPVAQMQEHGQPPEGIVQEMAPGSTPLPLPPSDALDSAHACTRLRLPHQPTHRTCVVGSKPGFNLGAEGGPQMPELEELLKGMDGLPDMGGEGKDKCSLM
jgi:hypothetical protein